MIKLDKMLVLTRHLDNNKKVMVGHKKKNAHLNKKNVMM